MSDFIIKVSRFSGLVLNDDAQFRNIGIKYACGLYRCVSLFSSVPVKKFHYISYYSEGNVQLKHVPKQTASQWHLFQKIIM